MRLGVQTDNEDYYSGVKQYEVGFTEQRLSRSYVCFIPQNQFRDAAAAPQRPGPRRETPATENETEKGI